MAAYNPAGSYFERQQWFNDNPNQRNASSATSYDDYSARMNGGQSFQSYMGGVGAAGKQNQDIKDYDEGNAYSASIAGHSFDSSSPTLQADIARSNKGGKENRATVQANGYLGYGPPPGQMPAPPPGPGMTLGGGQNPDPIDRAPIGQQLPPGQNKPGGPQIEVGGRQLPETAPNPVTAPETTYATPPASLPQSAQPPAQTTAPLFPATAPPEGTMGPPGTQAGPTTPTSDADIASQQRSARWKHKGRDARQGGSPMMNNTMSPPMQGLQNAAPPVVY